MNKEELKKLVHASSKTVVIDDLEDKSDRTLLYGYELDRTTKHVYLKDGKIFVVIYGYGEPPREIGVEDNESYIPRKRIYPEKSDYEFCKLLVERGYSLTFLPFDDSAKETQFYGKIQEN